ncbi:5-aminolevulinate synthase [Marimonas lutisalis]|uniref:5-aminolevulinate synthase n=1 Tax=Marimonas lutisalis TaxID=2545756 RepID=UPI0010FA631D|nr:5-aminolevulinate synthase [Marimonas lutisalis]
MDASFIKTFAFILVAATGCAIATIGMKMASGNWSFFALALLLLGFFAATQSEVHLMRGIDLGVLYLLIIAVETVAVLGYAWVIGEGLGPRDAMGGLLILAGMAVVTH